MAQKQARLDRAAVLRGARHVLNNTGIDGFTTRAQAAGGTDGVGDAYVVRGVNQDKNGLARREAGAAAVEAVGPAVDLGRQMT